MFSESGKPESFTKAFSKCKSKLTLIQLVFLTGDNTDAQADKKEEQQAPDGQQHAIAEDGVKAKGNKNQPASEAKASTSDDIPQGHARCLCGSWTYCPLCDKPIRRPGELVSDDTPICYCAAWRHCRWCGRLIG